jgi:hypothetical protein
MKIHVKFLWIEKKIEINFSFQTKNNQNPKSGKK